MGAFAHCTTSRAETHNFEANLPRCGSPVARRFCACLGRDGVLSVGFLTLKLIAYTVRDMTKTKAGLLLGRRGFTLLLMASVWCLGVAAACQSGGKAVSQADLPPGSPEVMQPEELLKALRSKAVKPAIFCVGPRFLYAQAHIPGAEFIGPAAEVESLDRLRKRVASLPKNSAVILYCGCCPWEHCPNIRPAYKELQKMGFSNVKALYLANSFGTNWVDRGYPVEKENSGQ